MPLGRSTALGFLLNENGSGGIGEDNPLKFARLGAVCGIGEDNPLKLSSPKTTASRDAPAAALLGRPSGGRRESGGRPARGGRQPCPTGAPLRNFGRWLACRGPLWVRTRGGKWAKTCPYVVCGQLGAARSRQGESNEVGEVGSKRASSGDNGGQHV
jgi:hypothetical protein